MAKRYRTCVVCGVQFSYEIARGADRSICGASCRAASVRARKQESMAGRKGCEVDGCDLPQRSSRSRWCEKHYMRMRRNNDLRPRNEVSPPPPIVTHDAGYLLEYAPKHPMARGSRVYQHRRVFFDAHGSGPFQCHWCHKVVTWADMHVDHVNAVRDDNRPENLVAACPSCNQGRARYKSAEASRRRAKHIFALNGESLTASQWAARVGISSVSLLARIASGWPLERALTEGRGKTGPKPTSGN